MVKGVRMCVCACVSVCVEHDAVREKGYLKVKI